MTPASPSALEDAVRTHDLTKRYGSRYALHGLDLAVPRGTLFGFLGPNGAGKTTTIRILLGLLRATAGSASVLGRDCRRDGARLRGEVGYLPGDVRLFDNRSGAANLRFFCAARGGRGGADGQARRLADAFGLDLGKRVRSYSRGMKQKLGLIQALMHRPRLLVLDEPTTALDPLMREVLYAELRTAVREGRTVLFSSHTLSEVEQLCDHVAILRDGRLVESERIEALRARALRRVQVVFDGRPPPDRELPTGLDVVQRTSERLSGSWTGDVQPLVDWLARRRVRDLVIAPPDLEDLFRAYYAAPEAGASAPPAPRPAPAPAEAAR